MIDDIKNIKIENTYADESPEWGRNIVLSCSS